MKLFESCTIYLTFGKNIDMTYCIAICELFNENIHGTSSRSTTDINQRFIASYILSNEEFMDKNEWQNMLENMKNAYSQYSQSAKCHPTIRNYSNIVNNPNYYKLEIVQVQEMPGGELTAVIKTGYIKTLQRKLKKYINRNDK